MTNTLCCCKFIVATVRITLWALIWAFLRVKEIFNVHLCIILHSLPHSWLCYNIHCHFIKLCLLQGFSQCFFIMLWFHAHTAQKKAHKILFRRNSDDILSIQQCFIHYFYKYSLWSNHEGETIVWILFGNKFSTHSMQVGILCSWEKEGSRESSSLSTLL